MTKRHNQEKLSVLKRAIRHYGKRNQVQKAIEEMADVIIMLWQLEMIFRNGDEIMQAIDYKLKRLQKRITKGEQKWK